eukprot:TRINITY_DN56187_c0_g1_i1.p1 TRINITY_DN56187_c0_g1~~TRINITY_DN56187_c0_g1_i1.p1  ORF type:complete len:278 (+),score=48.08 TRINITY_DN56187_c0_g1_i1:59-835(+)
MDAKYASTQAASGDLSFIVSTFGGDQKVISGMHPDAPLSDLIVAAACAFELPEEEVKLLSGSGHALSRANTLAELALEDRSQLLVVRVETDLFDASRCEEGMELSEDGRVVAKVGGKDLTSVKGKVIVAEGSRRWRVRVDKDGGNLMIGVAHTDVPLSFSLDEWRTSYAGQQPTSPHVKNIAFVKSAGNTTRCWGAWEFGQGDVITVTMDADEGVVSFEKNDETLNATSQYPWTDIQGPVSLFINMDYHGDQVTIMEG